MKLPLHDPEATIDLLARQIVDRRLETPALFFFEMHRPLTFLAGQSVLVATPFLAPFLGVERIEDVSRLLSDRHYLDRLLDRIEELAVERDAADPPQRNVQAEEPA